MRLSQNDVAEKGMTNVIWEFTHRIDDLQMLQILFIYLWIANTFVKQQNTFVKQGSTFVKQGSTFVKQRSTFVNQAYSFVDLTITFVN